jgi:hypothetical protein
MSPRRRPYAVTAPAAPTGLALIAYAVRAAGEDEIAAGIARVGWGRALVLALAGARFVLRAEAWRWCMPVSARLPRPRAFAAFLAGDAGGSVTPLGLLASEPAKVFLTRHHLATRASVASLAAENVVYAASVFAVVALGLLLLAGLAPPGGGWRLPLAAARGVLVRGAVVALRLLRGTWDLQRGDRPRWRARLAALRAEALAPSARAGAWLWRVFGLDVVFHALAVVEVYLVLEWLLGPASPTLAQAVVFEALNRVITVAFKFVPFRVGVDEASSGALAPLLALDPAAGVALAVVRKARNLFWAGMGLGIAAWPARAAGRPDAAAGPGPPA